MQIKQINLSHQKPYKSAWCVNNNKYVNWHEIYKLENLNKLWMMNFSIQSAWTEKKILNLLRSNCSLNKQIINVWWFFFLLFSSSSVFAHSAFWWMIYLCTLLPFFAIFSLIFGIEIVSCVEDGRGNLKLMQLGTISSLCCFEYEFVNFKVYSKCLKQLLTLIL